MGEVVDRRALHHRRELLAGLAVAAGAEVRAAELDEAAHRLFPDSDVLVMAAAVADFRPPEAAAEKLSKAGREALELRLEPTTDVLAALSASRAPGQTLIGFAAEHGEGAVERARGKLERKGLDAVVVNDIARPDIGFDADHNEVTIVTPAGDRPLARAPKREVARAILDVVEELRAPAAHSGSTP